MVEVTATVRPGEGKASRDKGRGGGSGEGRTLSQSKALEEGHLPTWGCAGGLST